MSTVLTVQTVTHINSFSFLSLRSSDFVVVVVIIFHIGSFIFPRVGLDGDPSHLYLLRSWDYDVNHRIGSQIKIFYATILLILIPKHILRFCMFFQTSSNNPVTTKCVTSMCPLCQEVTVAFFS